MKSRRDHGFGTLKRISISGSVLAAAASCSRRAFFGAVDGAVSAVGRSPRESDGSYALVLMDATLTQRTPWPVVAVGRRASRDGVGSER
jgi:hypothetical protein